VKTRDENFGLVPTSSLTMHEEDEPDCGTTTLNLSDINVIKKKSTAANNKSQVSSNLLSTSRHTSNLINGAVPLHHGDRFIPCRSGGDKYELQY